MLTPLEPLSERPLVSIITPSFNSGAYIRETIESVLAQTYEPIEFRVLDAGSTDNTHDVLRSFGDRVEWDVKPDNGQSDCINRGWKAAKGEIIAWLCADDLLEPFAVARAVDLLAAHHHAAAVYGSAVEVHVDGSETAQPMNSPFHLWRLINLQDFVYQPAVFFRRAAVAEVGWLNEDLHYAMDWDLLIRLGERYPMLPVEDRLARVRIYPETKTSGGGWRRFRELARVIRSRADSSHPHAYWYYLLETYRNWGHQLVDRRAPRRVARKARAVVDRTYVPLLRLAGRRIATQWLEDRWAGPAAYFLVPPGREVHFIGEVPDDLAPVNIAVSSNGDRIVERTLGAGEFELSAPLPDWGQPRPVRLLVEADRAKPVPHHLVSRRSGSYRLARVEVSY